MSTCKSNIDEGHLRGAGYQGLYVCVPIELVHVDFEQVRKVTLVPDRLESLVESKRGIDIRTTLCVGPLYGDTDIRRASNDSR
jgi:hypothetical protein